MRATVAAPGKTYYDDRYNVTKNSNSGYNTFKTSLLRDYLIQLAESEEFLTADQKKNLIETTVCDMPRSFEDNTKDGSTECSNENPDKLLFTTITPYEYMRASIDENCIHAKDRSCANYNFLTTFGEYGNEWTVTPYTGSDYEVFTYEGGNFNVVKAKTKKNVYVVTTLSSLTRYVSGTGTKTDPYVIIKEKKSTITK